MKLVREMTREREAPEMKIILASGSPRRKELLDQVGIKYEVIRPVKEEVIAGAVPAEVVEQLSYQKAEEIAVQQKRRVVVIGSDTVVAVDGRILGKPSGKDDALRMLQALQGKVHQVFTGVSVLVTDEGGEICKKIVFSEVTDVEMYPMSEQEIEAYAATGEPLDKAGAYGIQGRSAVYIKGIKGDYNNVVGLPLARLYQETKAQGVYLTEQEEIHG